MRSAKKLHFMLVPSLACPAECLYCFGPHKGSAVSSGTMTSIIDFIANIAAETCQTQIKVTFHGGEPLTAGHNIIHQAFEDMSSCFGRNNLNIAIQSNLWLLDDKFCKLFAEYGVEIGTSLDGPEDITDSQRGKGYFRQTMRGIRRAQSYGLSVGCIATFTPQNLKRWRESFDFFLEERLGMSIHASVPPLTSKWTQYSLTPEQYGWLLRQMLDYYIGHRREITISTLNQMCKGVGCGAGRVCVFRDCLGMFLAIDPNGDIYPCQRFCGNPDYRLGNISERLTLTDIMDNQAACRMIAREEKVREVCKECRHISYCKGGCAYNAWAGGEYSRSVDPYCTAFRDIFDYIHERLCKEMTMEENINAIADRPFTGSGNPLLKKGPLIEIAREGSHPQYTARTAKRIIAAVELARGPDIFSITERLVKMGIARTDESGMASLSALENSLKSKSGLLNNLYLHITFRCQLECTHCYSRSDACGLQQPDMPVSSIAQLICEAKEAGFRQVIITGGEPLLHIHREKFLLVLKEKRAWAAPMNIVLRTNFAMTLTKDELFLIASAADQVVVSVDGNEKTHDDRRGKGSYASVLYNLKRYAEAAEDIINAGDLSLSTVMKSEDARNMPGNSVLKLAHNIGVKRTRFRPLLPIGRAKDWTEPPTSEALWANADIMELIEGGFKPVSSCGLGQNLYVEPSGESFPCYAYHKPHAYLGNVITTGLNKILNKKDFLRLSCHNVDTNNRCQRCDVRYLCGGACRAWGGEAAQYDLNAGPSECEGLKQRALELFHSAQEYLGLTGG